MDFEVFNLEKNSSKSDVIFLFPVM